MFAWLKPRDLMCTFTGHTVQRHPTRNLDLDTRHEPSLPSLDTYCLHQSSQVYNCVLGLDPQVVYQAKIAIIH